MELESISRDLRSWSVVQDASTTSLRYKQLARKLVGVLRYSYPRCLVSGRRELCRDELEGFGCERDGWHPLTAVTDINERFFV